MERRRARDENPVYEPMRRHAFAAWQRDHAFNRAPAALRIFRFAAYSVPRVLELAHVSAFLRECAIEFGSADAALPVVLRVEYIGDRYSWRNEYFELRYVVERNAARCPWLAAKVLTCRSVAPMPAVALAPDVTRHDVNWGAARARRHGTMQLTHDGFGLRCRAADGRCWAQGAVGVTSGKHCFQVCFTPIKFHFDGRVEVGWIDKLGQTTMADDPARYGPGWVGTLTAGASYELSGAFFFGTPPLTGRNSFTLARENYRECMVGCMLDLDATPARMTIFVGGEPLQFQCEYDFPKDGRAWFPFVTMLNDGEAALHSCAT